ncbi:DUF222 domain-containing protein, partial [Arthrobacter glacialis]|uniref:DUF222 domain-containing protein n=1 Tax=Arthrobacter glacialis TaxID=1664 RepID=UPI000D426CA6
MARLLAGIVLPSIESFGPDNAVLVGLPAFVPSVVSGPEPLSRVGVARGVYDAAMAALAVVKRLEDATAACKAALVAKVLGAAQVEATAVALDRWQSGVAASSACADIALTLCIPERSAAVLAHQAVELLAHPGTMAALEAGELSFRHAGIIIDEGQTLAETPGITARDMAAFEARLLVLAPGTTASGFAAKARRARESTHPSTLTTRTKQAYEKRAMTLEPGKDGMSWLTLHLPAVAAEGVWVNCTRTARAIKHQARRAAALTGQGAGVGSGEYRTLTQLRIDVAAALLLNQHPLGENPTRSGTDTGTGTDAGDSTSTGSSGDTPNGPTASGSNFNTTMGGTQAGGTDGDAGAVGEVPFGSKSAFGVTLFDQDPVWTHRDPHEPAGRYLNPDPTPKTTAAPEPHPSTSPSPDSGPSTSPGPSTGLGLAEGFVPEGAGGAQLLFGVVCGGGILPFTGGNAATGGGVNGGPGVDDPSAGETGADEVLFGELLGDGSGYVDGVVDGIPDSPERDYLDQ